MRALPKDVVELLQAYTSDSVVSTIARVALANHSVLGSCNAYMSALSRAIEKEPPSFGTRDYSDIYQRASADARWMAVSMMTNAEREGDGAKRLWSLSACSPDTETQRLLKVHAVDESRHALLYLALLDLTFPDMIEASFRVELRKLSPHYSMRMKLAPVEGSPYAKKPSIDDFIQMNIAEIRTTVHHIMQRRALSVRYPNGNRVRIVAILDSLLTDELNHVAYTAMLIERLTRGGMTTQALLFLFSRRLADFNQITNDELGIGAFDCSVSCCEKRPHCRSKAVALPAYIDAPI
jgi:hypothetical protein